MILQTERLIIRNPEISDFDTYWMMKNDKETTFYTGGTTKLSKDEYFDKYKDFCDTFTKKNSSLYSIIEKDSMKYIGYCGFQYCELLNDMEILYGFARAWWNRGFAFESANSVISHGLNELELPRVSAAVNPKNIASEKILQKIGMQFDSFIEWPNQGKIKKYIKKR